MHCKNASMFGFDHKCELDGRNVETYDSCIKFEEDEN